MQRLLMLMFITMLFSEERGFCQKPNYPNLGAYSSKFNNILSTQINVASLSGLNQFSAGLYAEKKFLIKEFSSYQIVVGLRIWNGGIGISAAYSGDVNLNSSQLEIGYAKALGAIQIGLSTGIHRLSMAGYGSTSNVIVQAATIWHVSTKIHLGMQLRNPQLMFAVKSQPNLSASYRFGIGYESSDNLLLALEIYKESGLPANVHAVLQYIVTKKIFLSTGIMGASASPFLGVGLKWSKIKFEINFGYHSQLGISPGTAFIFENSETDQK